MLFNFPLRIILILHHQHEQKKTSLMSIHSEIRHFYCCMECVMQEGRLDDSDLRERKGEKLSLR